jgi:hypothetical protein
MHQIMNMETKNYLVSLLTAWAQNADTEKPVALPVPPGVDTLVVCDTILNHHVHVALAPFIPEEVQTLELRENLASARERTAFLLLELERILPSVTWEACRPVVLKGAALAPGFYAQPDQRWFLDLDILVPRGLVDEVCHRLEGLGYHAYSANRDPLYYDRHHLHRMMVGPQGSCVEVHWDLTLPASIYQFDLPGVFNRANALVLGRETMLTAAPVDQILHGVYQHIADGFLDLKRVMDMSLLLKKLSEDEILYLVKESRRTKMNLALGLSLHLVKAFCGVSLPNGILNNLKPGWATNRILHGLNVESAMLERKAEKVDGFASLVHFLMVPSGGEKMRESSRFIWGGEAELMDRGHWHNEMPGFSQRMRLSLYLLKTLLNLGGRATKALVHG